MGSKAMIYTILSALGIVSRHELNSIMLVQQLEIDMLNVRLKDLREQFDKLELVVFSIPRKQQNTNES
jgi:hypothetical protein